MLPLRLKMTNFLAYRDETVLDFDGLRLACLTGQNGAGKSSILDALTFALWGKGRSGHAEMIHAGREEATVELDFEHQGQRYKVVRRVQRGRNARHTCDLFSISADGTPLSLGGQLRETNQRIERLLRMPYETFVNSAYLQQGKADAFALMRPAERKALLADILGMQDWERYEENAKQQRDTLREALRTLEGRRAQIQEELTQEPLKREQLAQAEATRDAAQAQLEALEAAKQALEGAEPALREAQTRRAEYLTQLERLAADLTSEAHKAQQCRAEIDQHRAILAQESDINAGYQQLLDAQQQNEAFNRVLQRLRPLEAQRAQLEQQIAAARADLEKQLASQQALIAQLTEQAQAAYQPRLEQLAAQIAQLEALEAERAALQQALVALSDQQGSLRSEQKRLEADGKKRNEQIKRLEALTDPTCPTCGQPLTDDHRASVLAEWQAEVAELREAYARARDQLKELDAQVRDNQAQQEAISRQLAELPRLRREQGELQQAQKAAQAAQGRLQAAVAARDGLTQRLQQEDYALGERAQLRQVQAELAQLTYDSDDHAALQATLNELRRFEAAYRQLDLARQMLPRDEAQLAAIEERLARLTQDRAAAEAALAEIDARLPALMGDVERYRALRQQVNEARLRLIEAQNQVAVVQQELVAIEAKKQRLADYDREEQALRRDLTYTEELVRAFGKNGVQAMLIESAIPELEDLANDLLRRMTDGRMNVRLVMQRETRAGTTAETLEVEIADERGTRSYEMYSGGEAFRVNFALRVALAKLVARRAGAQVRTLFIDEGFGTQDEEGRFKLVEAITTVQHDFDLILVITHMEDLRDAFPVHILVEKTPQGSRLSLR